MTSIQDIIEKYHWIKLGEDGALEIYLDNHALSAFRNCPAYFKLSIMDCLKNKHKAWSLEFGILFHRMVEVFYSETMNGTFDLDCFLSMAKQQWIEANLEQFEEHKMYKTLGGLPGFLVLIVQYISFYNSERETIKPIGLEISFGKAKEVPLGEFEFVLPTANLSSGKIIKVRCYLSGRIDLLGDNGTSIGPLDHKTMGYIRHNPTDNYEPHEGMTGYLYAAKHIIKTHFPQLLEHRRVDKIWMNFIQITPDKDSDLTKRFKRLPIYKTEFQLEQYRLRMLRTFEQIAELVLLEKTPTWNTNACNIYSTPCQFKNLHRQPDPQAMINILKADFTVGKAWNPDAQEEGE